MSISILPFTLKNKKFTLVTERQIDRDRHTQYNLFIDRQAGRDIDKQTVREKEDRQTD
jgi:hypothetical protein